MSHHLPPETLHFYKSPNPAIGWYIVEADQLIVAGLTQEQAAAIVAWAEDALDRCQEYFREVFG